MMNGLVGRSKGRAEWAGLVLQFGSALAGRGLWDSASNTRMGAVWSNAGAPTSGGSGTFVNLAQPGDLLVDTTNKVVYQNTGTAASPTWSQMSGAGGLSARSAAGGIAAAGTSSQSAATPLTADFNQVSTVAANAGVALPAATPGREIVILNSGANTLKIWPINGGTDAIDGLSANANTTLSTVNRIASLRCFVAGTWISSLGGAVAS